MAFSDGGQVVDQDFDSAGYFSTRLQRDPRRGKVWRTLTRHFFQGFLGEGQCVVDLGAGWCDFINNIDAPERIAVDTWPGVIAAAGPGVQSYLSDVSNLDFLADSSVDLVFASNLVEHLERPHFMRMLDECKRVLVPDGQLVLVQPNYRLCSKRYFDDFTHVSVWSDVSLADFVSTQGWHIVNVQPRFLPFSVKSRLPVSEVLIKTYLNAPIKPFAGQMLLVARPAESSHGP